jgi:Phage tail lysozyme
MTFIPSWKNLAGAAGILAIGLAAAGCVGDATDESNEDSASADDALSAAQKTAYEFFVAKGLKGFQSAAIVGNLIQESSVIPTAVEYGGGPGRGIAQWSAGGRWDSDGGDNVKWYAKKKGESAYSLKLQLEFIWYELQTFSGYGLSKLKASSTISQATIDFEERFEGCGTCDQSNRIAYAKQVLKAYGH